MIVDGFRDVEIRGLPPHKVVVGDPATGRWLPLPQRVRHSPTGYSWGYGGSGPSDLALAILLLATGGDVERSDRWYQAYKWEHVARWPANEPWSTTVGEVLSWLAEQTKSAGGGLEGARAAQEAPNGVRTTRVDP